MDENLQFQNFHTYKKPKTKIFPFIMVLVNLFLVCLVLITKQGDANLGFYLSILLVLFFINIILFIPSTEQRKNNIFKTEEKKSIFDSKPSITNNVKSIFDLNIKNESTFSINSHGHYNKHLFTI